MSRHYIGWRKTRLSEPTGNCIEVGVAADGTVGIRDTKQHRQGPVLELTSAEWADLLNAVRTLPQNASSSTSL
ncbi:DUF397 domain-containing protein [Actinomadura adrarensis]|uniref:DUF397 domain-containing protein n=1 Tax=Actinomadura adrarensis TaxID=1819600 RepID=A0ABW3CNM4_9ACTN